MLQEGRDKLNVIIMMIVNLTNTDISIVLNVFQHDSFIYLYNFNKGKINLDSIYSI